MVLAATLIFPPMAGTSSPPRARVAPAVAAAVVILQMASAVKGFFDAEDQKRTQQEIVQKLREVQILKFFEEAPLDRAELLFRIVKDKMRSRIGIDSMGNGAPKKKERNLSPEPQPKSTGIGTG